MNSNARNEAFPSLIKISGYISLAVIVLGLLYRFVILRDKNFDLENFLAYSIVSCLFLAINTLFNLVIRKGVKECSGLDTQNPPSLSESQERRIKMLAVIAGATSPLLKGIPVFCVMAPPVMALWGDGHFYEIGGMVVSFLGLTFLTTTASKLTFFSMWFFLGSLIIHLQVRASWIYWTKTRESTH